MRMSEPVAPSLLSPTTQAAVQRRHLDTLLTIARAIGTILDQNLLIDRIMAEVTRAFQADRSTLFLHDPAKKQLWSRVAQGLGDHHEIRIPDHVGIAGSVFQEQNSLLVSETFDHPSFRKDVAEKTGYVPRSMLVVPISHHPHECIGVLQVLDQRVAYFTDSELSLLEAVSVQVAISLDNARLYQAQRRQFNSFVKAFSAALDARDPVTQLHSVNVANNAMGIAHYLNLPKGEQEWLRVAGLLHDVGKIGTPEAILTKPGKLTDEEYGEMKRHAAHSRTILSKIEFADELKDVPFIAPAHHEKLDGSGYPDGLTGDQLPLKARILCVADICHALMQDRPYRPGMTVEQSLTIIDKMTPHHLDAGCVTALKKFLGVLPP